MAKKIMAEKPTAKGVENQGTSEPPGPKQAPPDTIEQFVSQLTEEQRMLVLLKNELYEGSWEAMRQDLSNRLDGKPYIFKLANRIKDDMERIEQLQTFETAHDVNLADYVTPPGG